jgi:hypothetical protein
LDSRNTHRASSTISKFKALTEDVLPRIAREQKWPIRLDHCFKRICLDNAFGDVWHNHLQRPAERHLQEPELDRVIQIAEQIIAEGRPALQRLNRKSLQWRGKLRESQSNG